MKNTHPLSSITLCILSMAFATNLDAKNNAVDESIKLFNQAAEIISTPSPRNEVNNKLFNILAKDACSLAIFPCDGTIHCIWSGEEDPSLEEENANSITTFSLSHLKELLLRAVENQKCKQIFCVIGLVPYTNTCLCCSRFEPQRWSTNFQQETIFEVARLLGEIQQIKPVSLMFLLAPSYENCLSSKNKDLIKSYIKPSFLIQNIEDVHHTPVTKHNFFIA